MFYAFGGSAPREEISHAPSCIHEASFSMNFVLYSHNYFILKISSQKIEYFRILKNKVNSIHKCFFLKKYSFENNIIGFKAAEVLQ